MDANFLFYHYKGDEFSKIILSKLILNSFSFGVDNNLDTKIQNKKLNFGYLLQV